MNDRDKAWGRAEGQAGFRSRAKRQGQRAVLGTCDGEEQNPAASPDTSSALPAPGATDGCLLICSQLLVLAGRCGRFMSDTSK